MRKVIYKSSRLREEIGGKESQEAIARHEGKPAEQPTQSKSKPTQECIHCGLLQSTIESTNVPCQANPMGTFHDFGFRWNDSTKHWDKMVEVERAYSKSGELLSEKANGVDTYQKTRMNEEEITKKFDHLKQMIQYLTDDLEKVTDELESLGEML